MRFIFQRSPVGLRKVGGVVPVLLFLVFCAANLVPLRVWATPTIAQLTIGVVTGTTAVISWTTNTPADSFISYVGTGESQVQNVQDDNLVTSHSITLTGLKPLTQYSFTVSSADAEGENVSLSGTPFTTLSGPATPTPPPPGLQLPAEPTSTSGGLQYVPPVSLSFPSPYPTGTLALEGSTVYFLMAKDGVKIPFSTLAAFTGLGYQSRNVQKIDIASFRVASGYVISSASEEHPWGSWLRAGDGTLYYSHSSGLIGVPSMEVFVANGGKPEMIVPLNAADKQILQTNPNLPVLQVGDDRML